MNIEGRTAECTICYAECIVFLAGGGVFHVSADQQCENQPDQNTFSLHHVKPGS